MNALYGYTAVHGAMAAGMLLLMQLDSRKVRGVNTWLKPFKFHVSIGLYTLVLPTIGKLVPSDFDFPTAALATMALLAFEQGLILFQAARGRASHFNIETKTDAIIFQLMGLTIIAHTAVAAWITYALFIPPASETDVLLWSARLGMVLFVLGSVQGFLMVRRQTHVVGAAMEDPGLPLLQWKVKGGDLRVAHFIGLHGLQLLLLTGMLLPNHPAGRWTIFALASALMLYFLNASLRALAAKTAWKLF